MGTYDDAMKKQGQAKGNFDGAAKGGDSATKAAQASQTQVNAAQGVQRTASDNLAAAKAAASQSAKAPNGAALQGKVDAATKQHDSATQDVKKSIAQKQDADRLSAAIAQENKNKNSNGYKR